MFISEFFSGTELQSSVLIVLNLILIESLLSADNAAVLATMVMDLPKEQRGKALRYGILGAYFFRAVCLVFAFWLVKIWWLKPLGGLYLLYLCFSYFLKKSSKKTTGIPVKKEKLGFRFFSRFLSPFWSTVIMIEVMDLAFSIDNVFAAVAFTDKIYLIMIGVFIGILAMRFVAQGFVRLMEIFSFLGPAAFIVIGILGLKLLSSLFCHFYPSDFICRYLEGEHADLAISLITVFIFLAPLISSLLFNFPKRKKV